MLVYSMDTTNSTMLIESNEVISIGKQYDSEFKSQAVRLATERNKSVAQVAEELGVPSSTWHGWIKATHQDPKQPFMGSGQLRSADQAARDRQKRLRD